VLNIQRIPLLKALQSLLFMPSLSTFSYQTLFMNAPRFLFHLATVLMVSHTSVINYSTKTAILTLAHNFPEGSQRKAEVDVRLLLETLTSTDTRIGEWVNIIGYITEPMPTSLTARNPYHASIQAIVLWSAGSIKLDDYEKILAQT
jgi:hypothetical protein